MLKSKSGGHEVKVTNTSAATKSKAKKRPIINTQNTGYIATAGIGLSVISGVSKYKTLRKSHKFFAGLTFIAAATHIYIATGWKRKS